MSPRNKVLFCIFGWLALITALHGYLNVNWGAVLNDFRPPEKRKIVVAYVPVTCQLTCPVTDYISKFSENGEIFLPRMFQGFPEIKEALISNKVQAAFIVAPLAIALVSQGVPIKVVYLGHRYGSALVVRKNGPVKNFTDLRGKTVAIPSRFSDERLILFRAMKVWGMKPGRHQDGRDGTARCFRCTGGRRHRWLCHGRAFSIASGNGGLRTHSFPGPRLLARLHVVHSCRAAGPNRQPARNCAGSS